MVSEEGATRLGDDAASLLQTGCRLGRRARTEAREVPVLAVYGRNGQRCGRCGQTIECQQLGGRERMLYWCPDCQQYLDSRSRPRSNDDTPMDPHPAAQAYLAGLPWNRENV